MYNLVTDGVRDFYARRPGAKRLVRREPLSGLADGVNVLFFTPSAPWLEDTLRIYVGNDMYGAGDLQLCDADGGLVQFYDAPATQPLADYTAIPLTTQQVIYYAWAGFELMESLWPRGLMLSVQSDTYSPATYESATIYLVGPTRLSGPVADPVCGSLTFSTSRLQRALLAHCIEMAYLDAMLYEASLTDVNFSERVGGARVDALGRPKNIATARQVAWQSLRNAVLAAMDEAQPNGEHYGLNTVPQHTAEYEQVWQWKSDGTSLVARGVNWGGL